MKVMDVPAGRAAVIGGGPAGLMAAETLARANIAVTIYDRMPSLARKFLMAGRGGLNLTHSEEFPAFLSRYGAAKPHLRRALDAFPPERLRSWSEALGQPTFVGTSGRVFPKAMKRHLCCAPGCGGWTRWESRSRCGIAGPGGTMAVRSPSMRPMAFCVRNRM